MEVIDDSGVRDATVYHCDYSDWRGLGSGAGTSRVPAIASPSEAHIRSLSILPGREMLWCQYSTQTREHLFKVPAGTPLGGHPGGDHAPRPSRGRMLGNPSGPRFLDVRPTVAETERERTGLSPRSVRLGIRSTQWVCLHLDA